MFSIKICFYQRLAISLVIVFILVSGVFFSSSVHLQKTTQLEAEQRLHKDLAIHLIQDNPILAQGIYDKAALKNLFHTMMVMGPNFEFYYLSPNGDILTYATELAPLSRMSVDLEPILAFIKEESAFPVKGIDPRRENGEKIFSAAPVFKGDELQGYIYIIIGGKVFDSIVQNVKSSTAIQHFSMFAGSALVFLLVALLILFKSFTRPMKILSDDMEMVSHQKFDKSAISRAQKVWKTDSHNEVHRLGTAFNGMLHHISKQIDALQQVDTQRRLLLADISHDLRTPLSNLQGYIETLDIQNESLSPADRKRFIEISLKNARNLKQLIDQIFELAYLESGQVTLNFERFSIFELLHDVTAKFTLSAQDKKVAISVTGSDSDLLVCSDIAKLERILTNLIDNALRHTPKLGRVSLKAYPGEDVFAKYVTVEIIDTGNGISESELPYIFDARYQASNQCKDNKIHTGLGLAICKQLTQILHCDISVESFKGQGTRFIIQIPTDQPKKAEPK